jgi:hypothetical protein
MSTGFQVRTRTAWLFGAALLVAGALLVLQLGALLAWQYSVALEIRAWPRLSLALLFADHSQATGAATRFLPYLPELRWPWFRDPQNAATLPHVVLTWLLGKVHLGVPPAVLGVLIGFAGYTLMLRERYALYLARREKEDRLRRRRHYHALPQDTAAIIEAADVEWRRERAMGGRRR